jgi:hypothetical protein
MGIWSAVLLSAAGSAVSWMPRPYDYAGFNSAQQGALGGPRMTQAGSDYRRTRSPRGSAVVTLGLEPSDRPLRDC